MVPPIFLIFLGIGLLIATYRDIKTREVPDTVNYCLIIVGLLGSLIVALATTNIQFFLEHLYGFLIGAGLGLIMFFARQWGGGDAKLIMGVGAIIGFSLQNFQLVEFMILLILCGAAYGIIYTLYLALIKHRKAFIPEFKRHIRTPMVHRLRIGLVGTGVIVVVILFFVSLELKIILGFLLLGLYLLVYSWIFTKSVEKNILLKAYPVGKLTEGDWVVQEVKVGKKVIIAAKNTGITLKQIAQLKKAKIKKVLVKEGIAFVPGFLLAYIVLLIIQFTMSDAKILAFLLH